MSEARTIDINRWVLSEGRGFKGPGEFLEALCGVLREHSVAVDRSTIGAPVLHPVAQSAFAIWDAETGLRVNWVKWDEDGLERLRNSPIHNVYAYGQGADWRLDGPGAADRYEVGPELVAAGFVHYITIPLPFSDGTHKALTAQTKARGGFTTRDVALLNALVPAIATVFEGYVQRAVANTLMNTFVGFRAGARVLDGQIARGDGETIKAVIWMSDLRNFTALATGLAPVTLIDRLNRYFDAVTKAVMASDGEVLKFIGDAVLAVFPVEGDVGRAVANAEMALDGARDACRSADWPGDLSFGTALHLGDVFYGNVGGETRLDFTVIGQSVNLVSRVEGRCSALNEPVLVTRDIVRHSARAYRSCGDHELKGVAGKVTVFAPA